MNKSRFSLFNKSSTFISGVFAVGIYFTLILVLLFYFNTKETQKSTHYVKKNEDRIRVTMAVPKRNDTSKKQVQKKNTSKKSHTTNKKQKKDTVKKQKDTRKKIVKEKIVKKVKPKPKPKKNLKKQPPKKVNKPKDLFANVSASKKSVEKHSIKTKNIPKKNNLIKATNKKSASELVSSTHKKDKKSDKGIENAYLARIEEKLKGWPAQSEYAGERAKVWIKVQPSGRFVFKVTTASGNDAFNTGLIDYLKQLQGIGFGPHKGNRAYTLNVEFIATE